MNIKKILLSTVASGFLSTSAMAENVGGVVWDPGSIFDFSSSSNLVEDLLDPGPDSVFGTIDDVVNSLNGFGVITNLNGTGEATFCPGCELTFEFGGFLVSSVDVITDAPNTLIDFTGGWVNFYVDTTTAYDINDITTANNGSLWLSLAGHAISGSTIQATLTNFGGGNDAGEGAGLLDVTGGLAMDNFDTNTQTDGADWVFTSSFQPFQAGNAATDDGFELFGTADFGGSSIAVPEPSSLALLGLGMLSLGFRARRKQK